ncbi:MAG: hypothetical protein ACOYN0_09155 [Phycisphaerales bacterium]
MNLFGMQGDSVNETLPLFVAGLALFSLLPFILTMLTSFAKLVIVGGLIRQAVGTPQIPPTIVITGLSLILTIHIMAPVGLKVYARLDDSRSEVLKESLTAPFDQMTADEKRVHEITAALKTGQKDPGLETEKKELDARIQLNPDARLRTAARLRILEAAKNAGVSTEDSARTAWKAVDCNRVFEELEKIRREDIDKQQASNKSSAEVARLAMKDDGAITKQILALKSAGRALEVPLREFLNRHAAPRHIPLFVNLQTRLRESQHVDDSIAPLKPGEIAHDLLVLAPAFVLTELSEAFLIGFLIFVPFLVIDLVVSNVLLALGMQMLTPTMISLPLKLLLFVLMDGWNLILQGLVLSYV